MASWNALNEKTVCWKTLTTGMPRTYSVPVAFILARAPMYRLMNFMPSPLIMRMRQAMETTTASRQAAPRRQSKTKNITSMPTTIATAPETSGSMWASRVSVEEAQPSMTRRSSPEGCAEKYPSGRRMRCSVVALRMLDAQRKAARCVHMRARKYVAMLASAKPTAHHPYAVMPVATCQSGATAMRSRTTSQMHT